jgi:hypothetical protein
MKIGMKSKEKEKFVNSDKINYTEIYICSKENITNKSKNNNKCYDKVDVHLTEDEFNGFLKDMSSKVCPYKYFKKRFRTYVLGDIVLRYNENKDASHTSEVFRKEIKEYVRDFSENTIHIAYYKKKLPYNMFPSTMNMNDIFMTQRMVFLVNSHIYINCDIEFRMNENMVFDYLKPIYKIFINLNTERNVDLDNCRCSIEEAIKFVK